MWIPRVEGDIDSAGIVVDEENLRPGLAAIGCTKDASFWIRSVRMTECGDIDDVGVCRMDNHFADGAGVAQPDVLPRFAGIDGLINAVALRDIPTQASFTGTGIDHVGVGRSNSDCADVAGLFVIEDRFPSSGAIGGFPDTAADRAEIPSIRIAGDTGSC